MPREVLEMRKSMMTHGCMLWGAALYNNGSVPSKTSRYGESYSMNGAPQRIQTVPPPCEREIVEKGVVPYLDPLPRFEISSAGEHPANLRTRRPLPPRNRHPRSGSKNRAARDTRLSTRGLGTENRTDPVFIGLQKTRLLDPTLNFLGTNDHPGDYRSSGCSACHVVYANDRSPVHSGPYAQFGNRGTSFSADPMIPHRRAGASDPPRVCSRQRDTHEPVHGVPYSSRHDGDE